MQKNQLLTDNNNNNTRTSNQSHNLNSFKISKENGKNNYIFIIKCISINIYPLKDFIESSPESTSSTGDLNSNLHSNYPIDNYNSTNSTKDKKR